MRSRLLICAAILTPLIACTAAADAFNDRLRHGNALLRSGDAEEAIALYRELQVENPASEILNFALGCAQYEAAEQHLDVKDDAEAEAALLAARDAFDRAQVGDDPALRRDAAYNRANAVARLAMLQDDAEDFAQTVQRYEESIKTYEEVLRRYPELDGARQNLDHMRYRLKKMLQNPPPPPESDQSEQQDQQEESEQQEQSEQSDQSDQQDQQDQSEQQEQQEQSDQQDQSDQSEQPDQQNEQQQQQDESESQDESERQEQSEQSEQQDPQEQEQRQDQLEEQEQSDPSEQPDQAEQALKPQPEQQIDGAPQEPEMDRASVEAILRSLEEMDEREQKQMRSGPPDTRLREEWW